ncbi:MAG: nitrogen fixation protein NifX [Spirulinaceae cyanobacterium RM2_2_10]|nr:nitrogen fixation protein NifX [Spirulinaceae cyanobacterium SM2_1_0]NJO18810.1 nitrogen fixation protein NifX [Spirulinaceae cyanobacterium RM2_2_10]
MKIAFATNDTEHINAHFGSAKQIVVYEANAAGYKYFETLTFDGNLKEDGNEDKLLPKLTALADCTIVYLAAIGGSAAARLISRRVTPIKANSEEDKIVDVLDHFVQTLKGNPPPWLRKILQQEARQFDEEFSEIEEEVVV